MAKAKKAKRSYVSVPGRSRTITFNFEHLFKFEYPGGAVDHFNPYELSDEVLYRCMLNGGLQKLGDSGAGADSVSEFRECVQDTWNNISKGDWKARMRGGLLAQAIAELTGTTTEAVVAQLATMTDKAKGDLVKDSAIKEKILEIQKRALKGKPGNIDLLALFKPKVEPTDEPEPTEGGGDDEPTDEPTDEDEMPGDEDQSE